MVLPAKSNTKRQPQAMKCVSFARVHIRYHAIGVSDNPAVSSGVPIGLCWDVLDEQQFHIDDHWTPRQRVQRPRWLDPKRRREMLYEAGCSPAEVEAARDAVVAAQRDRLTSLPPMNMLEKLPWFVARSVRRTFRRKLMAPSLKKVPSDQADETTLSSPRFDLRTISSPSTRDLIVLASPQP